MYCPVIGANEKLNKKPRTVDEIGDAKKTWKEIDNKVCFVLVICCVLVMCTGMFMSVSATIFCFVSLVASIMLVSSHNSSFIIGF